MAKNFDFYGTLHSMRPFCLDIEEACLNKSFSDYMNDRTLRHAVERCLSVIGEAASRIRKIGFGSEIPDIHKLIAVRNVLMHEYDEVQDEIIFAIATRQIPLLRHRIDILLSQAPPTEDIDLEEL